MTKKQLRSIRNKANENFKELGVKTEVRLFEGKFTKQHYEKLDKTDGLILIGKKDNVLNVGKELNELVGAGVKTHLGDGQAIEAGLAQYMDNVNNVIGVNTEQLKNYSEGLKATQEEVAAFVINHGAGHNAGLRHPSDWVSDVGGSVPESPNNFGYNSPVGSMMTDGEILRSDINFGSGITLQSFISSPQNTMRKFVWPPNEQGTTLSPTSPVYKALIERFGNNNPVSKLRTYY